MEIFPYRYVLNHKNETDMNRKIVLIISIAVLLVGCNSSKNDLQILNLKGEIWKIKVTCYEGE